MDSELLELQQPRTRLCEAGRVAEEDEFPSPECLSHEASLLAPSLRMSTQRRRVSHNVLVALRSLRLRVIHSTGSRFRRGWPS